MHRIRHLIYPQKKGPWVYSHGPSVTRRSMGSLSRSAHGLFYLCIQAEEGRRAPKAKVAKIKETILLFSGHHPFLFYHRNLVLFNTFC
jgi:hypothetical protein